MTVRKAIFWTHLAVGVTAGLVILSMCSTGLMLAFEPQIVDFAERGVRLIPFPDPAARRLSVEELLAKAIAANPDARPMQLTLRSKPKASAFIGLGRKGAVYLNPYTGQVLGQESKIHQFLHQVEDWHRWLGNRKIGKPITGAGAIAFFLLALSGVYLWWPFKAFKFRKDLTGKARDWNWHTVAGFWGSLFILVITFTGIIMSYTWANALLYKAVGSPPPPAPAERREAPEKHEPLVLAGLDRLWTKAEAQSPGWQTLSLRLPQKAGAPVVFSIVEAGAMLPSFRSQLTLDRETGEVMKWEPYAASSKGRQVRSWITPMHTGRAWGLAGQIVNFIVALGGLMLIWTGFAMAWRRFADYRQRTKEKAQKAR